MENAENKRLLKRHPGILASRFASALGNGLISLRRPALDYLALLGPKSILRQQNLSNEA